MRIFLCLFISCFGLLFGNGVQDATTYHKNSNQQWDAAIAAIDSIAWTGSERVLDVGCGDGKITALLASKVPDGAVVGVDVSESMVRFAAAQFHKPNLSFEVADAANLPFEQAFDKVVSFSTLHWVVEQEKALRGIYKALAPGGEAFIITYGKAPMNLVGLSEKLIGTGEWSGYFPTYRPQRIYYTPEEYQSLLNRCGFDKVELACRWQDHPFLNRDELFQYVKPLINFIGHLPADLQQKFVNEVVDQIQALATSTEDGSIVFKVLILQAVVKSSHGG